MGLPPGRGAPTGGPLGTSVLRLAGAALVSAPLAGALARYLGVVLARFFWPQFRYLLRPGHPPLARVDHPLDELLPFEPGHVGDYLDFIRSWISALGWSLDPGGPRPEGRAARREARLRARREAALFVDELTELYRSAWGVYRSCVSTTRRPGTVADARFRLIYALDPHLHCVPSLHVMIVCQTWLGVAAILEGRGRVAEAALARSALRRRALEITESVLLVKQHSVNCVPAALYMTSRARTDFGPAEAAAFIGDLFRAGPGTPAGGAPTESAAEAVRSHMAGLYARFMDEGARGEEPRETLLRFLADYLA